MEYLGAWGTLIHEKNLKSKLLCQTPFNNLDTKAKRILIWLYYCLNSRWIKREKKCLNSLHYNIAEK